MRYLPQLIRRGMGQQLMLGFPWIVETALCIDLRERKQEGATC